MIKLKTKEEIDVMACGGAILAKILQQLIKEVKAGMSSGQLDVRARELAVEHEVKPSFLGYAPKGHAPYPAALCVSVNQAIVHGVPSDELLKEGDVVGLDMGIIYRGLYLDSAVTLGVGKVSDEAERLMRTVSEALVKAIDRCRVGNAMGDIGFAIQKHVEKQGFEVVRALVGHGVGYDVHEEPAVPNYGKPGVGIELVEGMVLALEPMITIGSSDVITAKDEWTVETKSGGLAAHEEHTVAITDQGPRVLTQE